MALSIGSLEIRIMPSNGKSISRSGRWRQRPGAVDAIKATVAVGLGGASRLKLRKISMSQQITTMSIGLEMEGTDWAVSIERSRPNSMIRVIACVLKLRWLSSRGASRWICSAIKTEYFALFRWGEIERECHSLAATVADRFLDHLTELTANFVGFRP